MLGVGEIDPLIRAGFARIRDATRAGAMRSLAAFVAEAKFDAFAVSEIESGDAFALATRFALQWAYRGRQAMFWTSRYAAKTCRDEYLPFNPARPFQRRASIQIAGDFDGATLGLFATRFSAERSASISELRVVRAAIRSTSGAALVFAENPQKEDAFSDLGFARAENSEAGLLIAARGIAAQATCVHI